MIFVQEPSKMCQWLQTWSSIRTHVTVGAKGAIGEYDQIVWFVAPAEGGVAYKGFRGHLRSEMGSQAVRQAELFLLANGIHKWNVYKPYVGVVFRRGVGFCFIQTNDEQAALDGLQDVLIVWINTNQILPGLERKLRATVKDSSDRQWCFSNMKPGERRINNLLI